MSAAERKLGLDSFLHCTDDPSVSKPEEFIFGESERQDADIHVVHSHLPIGTKGKTIFVAHGTPEHCFNTAVEQSRASGFSAGDPMMLSMHGINNRDATVTFWPRHAYIWKSLNPKARVEVVSMGVDTDFWKPVESKGKWAGKPSLMTCENSHAIKWPLDLILAFPLIAAETEAVLHLHYLPLDQHRFWYPLMCANGTMYRSYSSGMYMDNDSLRNAFSSIDYYVSPVRYGDFNSVCLEAAASGCKVISYKGNPYASYWIDEGSQIDMASQIIKIIKGDVPPRETQKVESVQIMTEEMVKLYESL